MQHLVRSVLLGATLQCAGSAFAGVDGAWHAGPGNPAAVPSGLDGQVRSILRDTGSACYIGGGFDAPFDAVAFWDGSSYRSAGTPFWFGEASTNAMIRYQGKIHAAGRYQTLAGTAILMRLDEENGQPTWVPLAFAGQGDLHEGLALAEHDGLLMLGGDFELDSGIRHIAAWDGNTISDIGRPDGAIRALESHDGALYAGGSFSSWAGFPTPPGFPPSPPMPAENLAVWNGSNVWLEAFGGADASVYALHSVAAGDPMAGLYVGGDFTVLGATGGCNGIARIESLGTGSTVEVMDGGVEGRVRAIQRWDQGVAVGGAFDAVDDSPPIEAFNIANWNASDDWEPMDLGLLGGVFDQPYGAPVLAIDRYATPTAAGIHAGGNFAVYGDAMSSCNHAATLFNSTLIENPNPFIDNLADGSWNEIDEQQYRLSPTTPGQPASLTWGVGKASFQRIAWDPESLISNGFLVVRPLDDQMPTISILGPQEPGPTFPPVSRIEFDPSMQGHVDSIRIGCVTSSGEIVESGDLPFDGMVGVDLNAIVDGLESGLVIWEATRKFNIGIRVGNPADTVVLTNQLGEELFRAHDVVDLAFAFGDPQESTDANSGRFQLEVLNDLVVRLDECGFGVGRELHRLDPAAQPGGFEILPANPLEPAAVAYDFEDAGQAIQIEGTMVRDAADALGPLYGRRSMMLTSADPGGSIGVLVEDRHEGQLDSDFSIEIETFEDRLKAHYRFTHPELLNKVTFIGEGEETEIPDDLTIEFEVIVNGGLPNGVTITEDDESNTTIIDWTEPGLVVFGGNNPLPPIEGPTGIMIGKVEGADGDDTWDVLQRSYMQVTSTKPSNLLVGRTDFTVIEGEPQGEPADLNGDGQVTGADLALILAGWGACPDCPADITNDDEVDGADLAIVLAAWDQPASSMRRPARSARSKDLVFQRERR